MDDLNAAPVRILLVEDEVIVAMDIQQRLEKLQYQVVGHAISGAAAMRLAFQLNPDLIFMDIKLAGDMDGIETAEKIRAVVDIPIIYLTAFADENTINRARLTEAYGYLVKPLEDHLLHPTIEVVMYKHKMEKKLRESEERYALATRAANDGIWDWNLRTNEIYFASRWRAMLGFVEKACTLTPDIWLDRVHPDDLYGLKQAIDAHLHQLTPALECEYRIMHEDGGYRWMLCRGQALFDSHQKTYRMAGSQADITTRKLIEDQLVHQALHDNLTGLPNRVLFMDRLKTAMQRSTRTNTAFVAVIFLDIDHFKIINDTLGHAHGDLLLAEFAERMKPVLRSGDTIARFGGDEFAIIADEISSDDEALKISKRIQELLQIPFDISGQEIFITASIGIVLKAGDYRSPEDLLRDADTAMYRAKQNGRARHEVFDIKMREAATNRLRQEKELRQAIKAGEFVLHYQPIFQMAGMELLGFEALIRWQHPTRGLLPPGEFIPEAEYNRLIIPIGEWVLHTACLHAQAWQKEYHKPLSVAINLSTVQLNNQNLMGIIDRALNESFLDPHNLVLEITESTMMENLDMAIQILARLQKRGIRIAIDDFGKGYSSLDAIKRLPSNTLKIDRSFINDMTRDDSVIVTAMVTMAHQLHLEVIAEGVETEEQVNLLRHLGCDQFQGYFMGKPEHPEGLIARMLSKRENAS